MFEKEEEEGNAGEEEGNVGGEEGGDAGGEEEGDAGGEEEGDAGGEEEGNEGEEQEGNAGARTLVCVCREGGGGLFVWLLAKAPQSRVKYIMQVPGRTCVPGNEEERLVLGGGNTRAPCCQGGVRGSKFLHC